MSGFRGQQARSLAHPEVARVLGAAALPFLLTIGYTFGMKVAISVPDPIFREAERLARRLKKSRSRLYGEAMAEYLQRHDPDALGEMVEQFYASIEDRPDPFVQEAARRTLAKSEW